MVWAQFAPELLEECSLDCVCCENAVHVEPLGQCPELVRAPFVIQQVDNGNLLNRHISNAMFHGPASSFDCGSEVVR